MSHWKENLILIYLHRPSLGGLHSKEGETRDAHVVVVKLLAVPNARENGRRFHLGRAEHKKFSPKIRINGMVNL